MINRIFIDMDGVVADFVAHFLGKFHVPVAACRGGWCLKTITGCSDHDVKIHLDDSDFWASIPLMIDADTIVEKCLGYPCHVAFLTDCMGWGGAYEGKRKWLRRHYPLLCDDCIMVHSRKDGSRNPKKLLASSDTLLIDDRDENVEEFRAAGGSAILIPRHWNSEYRMESESLRIFESRLKGVFNGTRIIAEAAGSNRDV